MRKRKDHVQHFPVVAIVFDSQNKILLTRRHSPITPYSHDKWQVPGGTIDFGEHPADTVKREVQEETGITIKLLSQEPFIESCIFDATTIQAIVLGFPAVYVSGALDVSGDEGTSDAKWFTYEEIDFPNCLPKTKELINRARKFEKHKHHKS